MDEDQHIGVEPAAQVLTGLVKKSQATSDSMWAPTNFDQERAGLLLVFSGGGEFYTPQCVVKLLVEMIEPFKGRAMTPAAGRAACSCRPFVLSRRTPTAMATGLSPAGRLPFTARQ